MRCTYLPRPNFWDTARTLDSNMLRQQMTNAVKVHSVLMGDDASNHPVINLWRGYEEALTVYGLYLCGELRWRNKPAEHYDYFQAERLVTVRSRKPHKRSTVYPPWFGTPELHESHRQALIYQKPDVYLSKFPQEDEPMDRPELYWPETA